MPTKKPETFCMRDSYKDRLSLLQTGRSLYMFVKALEDDNNAFCERQRRRDVLIVAADGFGCPGWVRISYCVDGEMIKRSMPAFEKIYNKYSK